MRLAIPDSDESVIYTKLCEKLRNNPLLKRVVTNFIFLDGQTTQGSTNQLPIVSLFPNSSNDAVKETYDKSSAMLRLDIILSIEGTDARDMFNLWGLVRKALFPGDGTTAAILNANQGVDMWLERAGTGVGDVENTENMVSLGTVVVRMLTNTGL